MNYTFVRKNLHLISRNEGKLKSYGSCIDVRGWSHDLQTRDHYLKDWIRSDMPISVLPANTVAILLRNMTKRNHARVAPRCHPDCKSKLILESICASCDTIRECLKNDETLEEYFQDEELETSHWPCDRCLDALKSIKLFWRILLDKLFGIHVPVADNFSNTNLCSSVRSVTKSFLEEINEQAVLVKNLKASKENYKYYDENCKSDTIRFKIYSNDFVILTPKESKHRIIVEDKSVDTEFIKPLKNKNSSKKVSQEVSVVYETVDFGCDTCNLLNEDVADYKRNVDYLQKRLDVQDCELENLKKENLSLKLELQHIYRTNTWQTPLQNRPTLPPFEAALENIPLPFESIEEPDNNSGPKNIDSEMIITLKNCKNETYTNISLLQVIHKSNAKTLNELKGQDRRQEDPVELLTRVHNTFGSIVQREIGIANEKRTSAKISTVISSTYSNMKKNNEKAAYSGSTASLHSISTGTVFVSTTD